MRRFWLLLLLIGHVSYSFGQKKESLFSTLSQMEGLPKFSIETDYKKLIAKKHKEEFQEANIRIEHPGITTPYFFNARIRSRGNIRKKVCHVPPVKIDFAKKDLKKYGLSKVDKLKLVFPCRSRDSDQKKLLLEELLYRIYQLIDTNALRTQLIDVSIVFEGAIIDEMIGFIVEDEKEYERRTDAKVVSKGKLLAHALDRPSFLKMLFFQYMIANVDWTIRDKHNIEMVKLPHLRRVVPLPYDFDYSGFVGQSYAVPHESLPIESVHDRYFFAYEITDGEIEAMRNYYLSIEEEVYSICESSEYLNDKAKEGAKKYLRPFFNLLRKPKALKRKIEQQY